MAMFTLKDCAKFLQISTITIRRMITNKTFCKVKRIGGQIRVMDTDFLSWVDITFLRRELSEGYEISYEREKKWLSEFARAEDLENKVEQMKQQIEKLQQERQLMKEQIEAMKQERLQELEQEQEQHHSRGRGR